MRRNIVAAGLGLIFVVGCQNTEGKEASEQRPIPNEYFTAVEVSPLRTFEIDVEPGTPKPSVPAYKPHRAALNIKPVPKPTPNKTEKKSTSPKVVTGRYMSIARGREIAKAYARSRLSSGQYSCLVTLWNHESGWNYRDLNRSSGAYGIPQALPGSKMASAGEDWRTNPITQVKWGLGYIHGRYGTPCGAWRFFQGHNWY